MNKTHTFLSAIVLACTCNITGAQTFEWAAGMGGGFQDAGLAITVDDSGNVYTTGYFADTVDFDPDTGTYNLISAGAYDVFVFTVEKCFMPAPLHSTTFFAWISSLDPDSNLWF